MKRNKGNGLIECIISLFIVSIMLSAIVRIVLFYNTNYRVKKEKAIAVEFLGFIEKQFMSNMSFNAIYEDFNGRELYFTIEDFKGGNHETPYFLSLLKEKYIVDLSKDYIKIKVNKDSLYDVFIIETEYVFIKYPQNNINYKFYRGNYEKL